MTPTSLLPWALLAVLACVATLLALRARRLARDFRAERQREDHLWRILDNAPVLLWTARPDGTLDYLNRTCTDFTGLSLAHLLDEGWLDQVHADDRQACRDAYRPCLEQRTPVRFEYRLRRHDGAYRWMLDQGVPCHEAEGGHFTGFVGSTTDIHERRVAEDLLRHSRATLESKHREVQDLAGRLLTAHEDERRHLARELHDDLTQRLARLAIDAGLIEHGHDPDPQAIGAMRRELVRISEDVHALSYRLHPSILDDLGLVEALRTECGRVAGLARLRVDVAATEPSAELRRESALCLFRVAQEALGNVARHAGASVVKVGLEPQGQGMRLEVTDDGAGFDPQQPRKRPSLGLASMRERVRVLDGTLEIRSAPGRGTTVIAEVPA